MPLYALTSAAMIVMPVSPPGVKSPRETPLPAPQLVAEAGPLKPEPATCKALPLPPCPGDSTDQASGSGLNTVPVSLSWYENQTPAGVVEVTRSGVAPSKSASTSRMTWALVATSGTVQTAFDPFCAHPPHPR